MKRFSKVFVLVATVALLCLCLASCGSSSTSLAGDPAVGTWTMTSAEYNGVTVSADDLKESGQMDEMPSFTINEDASCVFNFGDSSGEGTVQVGSDGTYTLSDDSDDTISFEIKDDTLRLTYEDDDLSIIMVFEQ
jgi:hypothetical protein